jgi:hypothetical protein
VSMRTGVRTDLSRLGALVAIEAGLQPFELRERLHAKIERRRGYPPEGRRQSNASPGGSWSRLARRGSLSPLYAPRRRRPLLRDQPQTVKGRAPSARPHLTWPIYADFGAQRDPAGVLSG